jgi:SAM-dependent methyltransferase
MELNNPAHRRLWDTFWATHASSESLLHRLLWRIRFLFSSAYAREISRATGQLRSPNLLEVGCGSARTLHYLEGHFEDSTCFALDISPEAVRLVNQLSPSYFTSVASAFNLPFPDLSCDVSFSIGLIEHFTRGQATQMMMEKVRVTRSGGWVCVMVPWASSVYNLIVRRAFGRSWPFGDEDPFHRAELAALMQEIGLADTRVIVIYGTTLLGIGQKSGQRFDSIL